MTELTQATVEQSIAQFQDEYLQTDYVSEKSVEAIEISDATLKVRILLGYPAAGIKVDLEQALAGRLSEVAGNRTVEVDVAWDIIAHRTQNNLASLEQVKNIIAVASGKGGVGKSTSAVNLALALRAEGASVGLLDADIYGPSQSIMLGIDDDRRPQIKDEKYWLPIQAHGLQAMSMGFLVDENTPMVWRGPMVSGALQQMINQTLWQQLDYLIVDMPPGTGDIQLTLSQKVPVTGAVIVTTPQDIALLDARKGVEMFNKVAIPVLGVMENMAVHICSECGHSEHIFGAGGGERIAAQCGTEFLGALPLDLSIREDCDRGCPTLVADPEGQIAKIYRKIARKVAAQISRSKKNYANVFPNIVVEND